MKKLIFLSTFFFSISGHALPDCPSDTSVIWNNCFGTYITASGDLYIGEFKDDEYHGQGTYTWINGPNRGDEYFGEFKGSILHGQGTYTYANGDKYVGEYKDGTIKGQGTYTFANGDKYVGEFKDGKRHGQGTITYANGTKRVGYYMNDDFVPNICEGMGLAKGTESFRNCVLKLIDDL